MKFDGQSELVYQLPKLEITASSNIPLTPSALETWLLELPILNVKQLSYQLPEYKSVIELRSRISIGLTCLSNYALRLPIFIIH